MVPRAFPAQRRASNNVLPLQQQPDNQLHETPRKKIKSKVRQLDSNQGT